MLFECDGSMVLAENCLAYKTRVHELKKDPRNSVGYRNDRKRGDGSENVRPLLIRGWGVIRMMYENDVRNCGWTLIVRKDLDSDAVQ